MVNKVLYNGAIHKFWHHLLHLISSFLQRAQGGIHQKLRVEDQDLLQTRIYYKADQDFTPSLVGRRLVYGGRAYCPLLPPSCPVSSS